MPSKSRTVWGILRLQSWDSIKGADGTPVFKVTDRKAPIGFLPVFDDYEKAKAWNHGKTHDIVEMTSEQKLDKPAPPQGLPTLKSADAIGCTPPGKMKRRRHSWYGSDDGSHWVCEHCGCRAVER